MVEEESGRGEIKSRAESMKGEAAWMCPEEPGAGWITEKRTDFSETPPKKTSCQVEETRLELVCYFFPPSVL